jgi:hypothetical protein
MDSARAVERDTINVITTAHSVEGLPFKLTALGQTRDSIIPVRQLTLSQTHNAPFLTGPSVSGPSPAPGIILTGLPSFTQSGTYTVNWTLVNDSIPTGTTTATTTIVVHDLVPPQGVQAYYKPVPANVPISNGTGVLTFVVWDGSIPESDPFAWNGYRVRRTIHGISPSPFEVAGQFAESVAVVIGGTTTTIRMPTSPICFAQSAPCNPDSFVFTGNGVIFRGFRNNALPEGGFVIDYPPGAPVDVCNSCWVFADLASLSGFRTEYAVTSIGPFDGTDYVESPLSQSTAVTVTPGTPPSQDLERVAVVPNPYKGSAQWDPGVGEGRVHFIHLPDGSTVRIFTTSGDLVRELTLNSSSNPGGLVGELEWDLKNGQGRKVVTGIYVYQVETPEGRTRKGHFVIIK